MDTSATARETFVYTRQFARADVSKTKLEAHVIELARSISRHGGTLGIAAAGEKRIARMDPHGLLTRGADVECWVSRVIRITNEYIGSRQEGRERRDRFTY